MSFHTYGTQGDDEDEEMESDSDNDSDDEVEEVSSSGSSQMSICSHRYAIRAAVA